VTVETRGAPGPGDSHHAPAPAGMAGVRRLQGLAWRLWRYALPRAVILMYHRVADLDSDPWGLAVTPAHFAEHMAVVRRHARPLHLLELARAHQRGRIPRKAAAVTFDDGYADNLETAKPLLARHDVPATVFITTGKIGRAREFWWDELDRLLVAPGVLPGTLRLEVAGRSHHWELGAAATHAGQGARRVWQAQPGSRLALYHAVYEVMRPLDDNARDQLLAQIGRWAGVEPAERTTHRTLSARDLHALADGGLVDIGAHSVSHPFLSRCPLPDQRREIQASRQFLEQELGRPVGSFAYPNGDYTPQTVELVRGEFLCACASTQDSVWHHSDRYQLPRYVVQDWDGHGFERRLRRWLAR